MRARMVQPGLHKNPDLAKCSAHARLLFVGLLGLADKCGRLLDRPDFIKGELFAFEPEVDVAAMLAQLATFGFVKRYRAGVLSIVQVVTWRQHQHPHRHEPPSVLPPPKGHIDNPGDFDPTASPKKTAIVGRTTAKGRRSTAIGGPNSAIVGIRPAESESESEYKNRAHDPASSNGVGATLGVALPLGPADPLAWARSLRDREEHGERLTLLQREKWRVALQHEAST